jgi:hypothetical protein
VTTPERERTDTEDARRWRYVKDRVFVGTGEDDEVYASLIFGQREDVGGLADSERRRMGEDSLDISDMGSVFESLIDAALSATPPVAPSDPKPTEEADG